MVILSIEVLVPGHEVGRVIGNVNANNTRVEEAAPAVAPAAASRSTNQQNAKPAPRISRTCF